MAYTIRRASTPPALEGGWTDGPWAEAETLRVDRFVETDRDSGHRPEVAAKVLYDAEALYVRFCVRDRYVRSVQTEYMGSVCTDSCVEFFVEPKPDKGYFNVEINAGGTLLVSYVEDPTRDAGGLRACTPLPEEHGRQVEIVGTLPKVVDPEIEAPTEWHIAYRLPLSVLEHYVGPLGDPAGQTWRANFYKCGDRTSHPHWASWAPVGELNFHRPQDFGPIRFAP